MYLYFHRVYISVRLEGGRLPGKAWVSRAELPGFLACRSIEATAVAAAPLPWPLPAVERVWGGGGGGDMC